ncbi:MAG: hypothetical protein WC341_00380 [Bacteroidales bacterium]|jgi:hypothetical protein
MADADVTFVGFDELARALDNADELFLPLASQAMSLNIIAIESEIAPYPPQPNRMRSGHLNTYVRGQGRYPKSAFEPDKNEPGGFKTKKVKLANIRLTSQQMDKKFRGKVTVSDNAITGVLRNEASYSGFVIGSKTDDPKQTDFHAETGWTSKEDAIANAMPTIEQNMNTAIDQFLRVLAGS